MLVHYVARARREHGSVVAVIPKGIRVVTGIVAGDYVVFELETDNGSVNIRRFKPGRKEDGKGADGGGC
jgi:bifunctional DNA-binding transcriptional regulator/antitoxin component of YhaV-PrlF toxin-antitoxin module